MRTRPDLPLQDLWTDRFGRAHTLQQHIAPWILLSLLCAAVYGVWLVLNNWNRRKPTKKIHRR